MKRPIWLGLVGLVCVVVALYSGWSAWVGQVPPQLIIDWNTESQVDTAGFFLYRAEGPDGPWTQVNAELIPATEDVLVGARYVYTDTGVLAGHTYYYQLEDVALGGQRQRKTIGSGTVPAEDANLLVLGVNLALSALGGLVGAYLVWMAFVPPRVTGTPEAGRQP